MVSLNDLDSQLASLEQQSETEVSDSDYSSDLSRQVGRKSKSANDAEMNALYKKKRRQGLSTICFQHLKGFCKYSKTCVFRHISAIKLETEDRLEVMRELRLRKFDPELAKVITDMNIPHCKSFSKTQECKFARKCQYWHIDCADIARWAGSVSYTHLTLPTKRIV